MALLLKMYIVYIYYGSTLGDVHSIHLLWLYSWRCTKHSYIILYGTLEDVQGSYCGSNEDVPSKGTMALLNMYKVVTHTHTHLHTIHTHTLTHTHSYTHTHTLTHTHTITHTHTHTHSHTHTYIQTYKQIIGNILH